MRPLRPAGRALRGLWRRWRWRGTGVALVVPVWNDTPHLLALLDQARDLGCFAQIVVVDDGSDPPVPSLPGVTRMRHATPRGGGAARNSGLALVRCSHLLFFDADDRLTPELPRLLDDLGLLPGQVARRGAPERFDLCLFKHADSRVPAEGLWGQPDWDERFWQAEGVGSLAEAGPEARLRLALTANYPWNRILSADFARREGIAFAETPVHQDIPPHWRALIRAERMLVSDRICAWHRIAPAGEGRGSGATRGRVSGRQGRERFAVLAALDAAAADVAEAGPGWQAALVAFAPGLLDWAERRIDPGLRDEFRRTARRWMEDRLGPFLPAIGATEAGRALRRRLAPPRAGRGAASPVRRPRPVPAAPQGEAPLRFVYLARGAGPTFEALARDIARAARPGDRVLVVHEAGQDDTPERIGRFGAMEGWGAAQADAIVAQGRPAGDLGAAVNVAVAALRAETGGAGRVLFLPAGSRLDPAALAQARGTARGHDLLVLPWRVWDSGRGRPVDPPGTRGRGFWRRQPGEDDRARAGRLATALWHLLLPHDLAVSLRCDEGRPAGGDVAACRAALARSLRPGIAPRPLGHLPARPDPGPGLVQALLGVAGQGPEAADWVARSWRTRLAGLPPGAAATIRGRLSSGRPGAPALLAALDAEETRRRAALALPARLGRSRLRILCEGRHTHRMPLSYPALHPLWSDLAERLPPDADPATADLILWAHPSDPAASRPEVLAQAGRRSLALLSEEPFWDSLFSPDPLAARIRLEAAGSGGLMLHQANHHRSAIFAWEHLPYLALTEPAWIARWRRLLTRNAALGPDAWRDSFAARPLEAAFLAERRPEPFHDLLWPGGDLVGLCAWRTRLAEAFPAPDPARIL
ncbi:glycosyltransferase family A protein, partial [Rubellimicrobium sp. CFH 75288]|uniref:glycosyltransferase family A protein n=1 Tax=Rubellimicrobium sp. CFH 75288 TaxID=2697034 RepID=UPI001411BDD4